jgi:hypothetical protein
MLADGRVEVDLIAIPSTPNYSLCKLANEQWRQKGFRFISIILYYFLENIYKGRGLTFGGEFLA